MLPAAAPGYPSAVLDVVVASDEAWVRAEVAAVLSTQPDVEVHEVTAGSSVLWAVHEYDPELVIVDLQIGNMGGMAVSIDLRLEESGGRLPHVPILLLLDRQADKFLARRSTADAMLVKPIDAGTLRRTVKSLLAAEVARKAAGETPSGPEEEVG